MGTQASPPEDRLVRKSDLDDAKNDLRREMRMWFGLGLVGLLGSWVAEGSVHAVETLGALIPFV